MLKRDMDRVGNFSLGTYHQRPILTNFFMLGEVFSKSILQNLRTHLCPFLMVSQGSMLFSVTPAVCCCVYLNSQEYITPARGRIGSNWFNWLKVGPGVSCVIRAI